MKTTLIALLAILSLAVTACGGDNQKTTETPTATPKPKLVTTYDGDILRRSEKDIKIQMRAIAVGEDNSSVDPGSLHSHCVPENDRNFTCESGVGIKYTESGYSLCATIDSTQRGYITNPETGEYDWKNTDTESSDPSSC